MVLSGVHAAAEAVTIQPAPAPSLTDRIARRFIAHEQGHEDAPSQTSVLPRLTQLALPLGDYADIKASTPSLFREVRPIGSVLSYEQASIEQIIPRTSQPDSPHDRLMLPGSAGLVLYDSSGHLALDWMAWSEPAARRQGDARLYLEPTVELTEIASNRGLRKLARRRCVVPLTRYSVPVRNGDIWSHRWITPDQGKVVCAAGVWAAERGEQSRFTLVTEAGSALAGVEPTRPMFLNEPDLLLWLRAPIKDVLAGACRRAAAD